MIFLIGKIFVYMLLACAVGAAAGWLWRNQQAGAQEGSLERALMDARSRLPQMETALRSRDERLNVLAQTLQEQRSALTDQESLVAARDRTVAELERSCAELRHRLEQTPAAPAAQRNDDLELVPGDPGSAPPVENTAAGASEPAAPAADGERQALEVALAEARQALEQARAEAGQAREAMDRAVREARAAAEAESAAALRSAQAALTAEQRRVTELTRERDLQHQALKSLEQQLELAEERRAANG